MVEYLTTLKEIIDSLNAINSSITKRDMVVQVLIGLPIEYDPFITTYGNMSNYDFEDIHTKFLILEQ